MDKNARELIQKMAASPDWLASKVRSGARNATAARLDKTIGKAQGVIERSAMKDDMHGSHSDNMSAKANAVQGAARDASQSKKYSSMRSIIDDIIKGAEQNTFGRPVNIQTNTEWTHFDTAKFAGMLQALDESGYSVKEASEYLGLTEKQVQGILTVVG